MTTIRKISIQGVRSYSDKQPQTIEFFQPLTIIVGANGSGKTTIIEALKFACTGQQPPLSDSGKSFVHDPKIVGTSLVKGQIKLGFRTADGKPVLAISSFQLSQKKNKREYKTLESVLRTINPAGKQVSLSHRCADMEKLVPQLMGVSKAVLENVIFCHQEDSNWPLSDSKTLKQKFDDIFSATRYTKALDVIKKLKNEKTKEARDMEADLKVLAVNMENAHKLEDDLELTKQKMKEKEERIEVLSEREKTIDSKLAVLGDRSDAVAKLQGQMRLLMNEKNTMIKELEKTHARMMTDYSDNDETLQTYFEQFEARIAGLKQQVEQHQQRYEQHKRTVSQQQEQYQRLTRKLGQLEAQAKEHESKKNELTSRMDRLCETHSLEKPDQRDGRIDWGDFVFSLERVVAEKQAAFRRFQQQGASNDQHFEAQITKMKQKESKLAEAHKSKSARAKEIQARVSSIQASLSDLERRLASVSAAEVQRERERVERELREYEHHGESKAEKIKDEMSSVRRDLSSGNARLSVLNTERKQLSSASSASAAVAFKRNQLLALAKRHNQALEQCKKKVEDAGVKLDRPLPSPLPESQQQLEEALQRQLSVSTSLEADLKHAVSKLEAENSSHTSAVNQAQTALAECETKLKMLTDRQKNDEQKISRYASEFHRAGLAMLVEADADFEREMEQLTKKIDRLTSEKALASSATLMYQKFLSTAKERHSCPLCVRPLSDVELVNFVEVNTDKLQRVTEKKQVETLKQNIAQQKQKLSQLRGFSSAWSDYRRLRSERDSLNEQVQQQKQQQKSLSASLAQHRSSSSSSSSSLSLASSALSSATQLSRVYNDCVEMANAIKADTSRLSSSSSSSTRTLAEVESESDALQAQMLALNQRLQSLSEQYETERGRKISLQDRLNKIRETGQQAERWMEEKDRLKGEWTGLESTYQQLKDESKALQRELEPLKSEMAKLTQERDQARQKQREGESVLLRSVNDIQRECDALRSVGERLDELERDAEQRNQHKDDIESSRRRMEESRAAMEEEREQLNNKQQQVAQSDASYQDILANLEYRQRQRELALHQEKMASLERELRQLTQDRSLEDISQLQNELRKLDRERSELRGALRTEEEQVKSILTQLHTERLHDIDARYKKKLIEAKTTQMACTDLDSYFKALDKALIKYHSLKMANINEVLKEYWRATYRGKDIDEVSIKSDEATEKAGGRRSYNYRVVMKQGDTELDMRGRCSAGQKVLASLLIRLALAETFCLQCGVLALDEPTTNLDQANIKAFAKALNAIITKRRGQKNFQLILITHDETFVEAIGHRGHADYYYRVAKNMDNNSVILKHSIAAE